MDLDFLLKETINRRSSDLHLSAGMRPMLRIFGELRPMEHPVLTKADIENVCHQILPEVMFDRLKDEGQVDFAYTISGLGRFRGNAFQQARGLSLAFRAIPEKILPLEDLELPEYFRMQCLKRSGLILITGPTGSGKSTTLAAIIDHLNRNKNAHIITVEDPIEFVHQSKRCLIHQRQIGEHSRSFGDALRSALREDPDIILVGEMRDLETIELALTAAETGHLVFGTLHTRNSAKTIDRMINVFPSNQQNQIRAMAAESLRAIISQVLLPRCDQPGMIPGFEILVMTSGIQNLIRESKIYQIPSAIQTGARFGMRSMEQSLKKLVLDQKVKPEIVAEFLTSATTKPDNVASDTHLNSKKEPTNTRSETNAGGFKLYRGDKKFSFRKS